eukprot:731946-Prymnesium_polylepis.1
MQLSTIVSMAANAVDTGAVQHIVLSGDEFWLRSGGAWRVVLPGTPVPIFAKPRTQTPGPGKGHGPCPWV